MPANFDASAVPPGLFELARTLRKVGERSWLVGGGLRDHLLGRTVADWDLATSAEPAKVQATFRRTLPTGLRHGTVTVRMRDGDYEVTTLRGEGAYSDGRHPDEVFFVRTIEEDLERRDFTVNAMAVDLETLDFVDPYHGRDDLEARILRAVRDPVLRFREDGLRVLRAARFAATLEFALDPATRDAIPAALDVLDKVSRERMRDEWLKAMKASRPSVAFRIMYETGILKVVAPALAEVDAETFAGALRAVDAAEGLLVRHAALLRAIGAGDEAAAVVERTLKNLRYANEEQRFVRNLVRHSGHRDWATESAIEVRRHLRSLGRADVPGYVALMRACEPEASAVIAERIERELPRTVFVPRDLAIGGDVVARRVGGGPRIREVLDDLMRWVDEDPARNQESQLVERMETVLGAAR